MFASVRLPVCRVFGQGMDMAGLAGNMKFWYPFRMYRSF